MLTARPKVGDFLMWPINFTDHYGSNNTIVTTHELTLVIVTISEPGGFMIRSIPTMQDSPKVYWGTPSDKMYWINPSDHDDFVKLVRLATPEEIATGIKQGRAHLTKKAQAARAALKAIEEQQSLLTNLALELNIGD